MSQCHCHFRLTHSKKRHGLQITRSAKLLTLQSPTFKGFSPVFLLLDHPTSLSLGWPRSSAPVLSAPTIHLPLPFLLRSLTMSQTTTRGTEGGESHGDVRSLEWSQTTTDPLGPTPRIGGPWQSSPLWPTERAGREVSKD